MQQYVSRAMQIAVYLLHRSPTKGVIGVTLKEAQSKRIPKISHLKSFGSVAYVPKENRSKSNATGGKLLFIRYFDQEKAYRILDSCNCVH